MPKTKSKSVKKPKHTVFAVALLSLLMGALVLIIPLSMSSVIKNTDNRSQAAGNTKLDFAERREDRIRHKFLLNSRYATNEYLMFFGTYIPEISNTLAAGQYVIDVQYQAREMAGRGFQIALVCDADTCPAFEENSLKEYKKGEVLYYANPSTLGRGAHRNKYTFNVARPMVGNTKLRITANSGTNIELDFLKLYQNQGDTTRQILMNPSFEENEFVTTEIMNGKTANSPSDFYSERDALNSSYKEILPNFLNQGKTFVYNGSGYFEHDTREQRDTRLLLGTRDTSLTADTPYAFKMTYFLPRQRVTYDEKMLEVKQGDLGGYHLTEMKLTQASSSCNYATGANCQFETINVPFTLSQNTSDIMSIFVDSQMELYIKEMSIINTQTNAVVWKEDFSTYTTFTHNIKTPKYWEPATPQQRPFGVQFTFAEL